MIKMQSEWQKCLFLMILVFMPVVAFAQKNIDKLVNKYSDKPYTVYTCIVRRNPRTRKVAKVIKSLTIANSGVYKQFENVFRQEGKRADYVNASNSNGGYSAVLRFDRTTYIFTSEGGSQCSVTVIWRDDDEGGSLDIPSLSEFDLTSDIVPWLAFYEVMSSAN